MPRHGRPARPPEPKRNRPQSDGSSLNFEDTPVSSPRIAMGSKPEYYHTFGIYRPLINVIGLATGMQTFRKGAYVAKTILMNANLNPRPYRHQGFAVPVLPQKAIRKAAEASQEFRHLTLREARSALLTRLPETRRHTLEATFQDVLLVGGETDDTNVYGVGLLLKNSGIVQERIEAAHALADISGVAITRYHIHEEWEESNFEMPLFLVDRKPRRGTLLEVRQAIGELMAGQNVKCIYGRPK